MGRVSRRFPPGGIDLEQVEVPAAWLEGFGNTLFSAGLLLCRSLCRDLCSGEEWAELGIQEARSWPVRLVRCGGVKLGS